MILKIIAVLVLAVIAGITYRMGGSGNYPRWTRLVGASVTMLSAMAILGHLHWSLVLCAGAVYGLWTTYFKKKGTDAYWWNWTLVGLAMGIAMIPYAIATGEWAGFLFRCAMCTILVPVWSETQGKDVVEEFGRGFIPIASLLFFI